MDIKKITDLSSAAERAMELAVRIDQKIETEIGGIENLSLEQCETLLKIVPAGLLRSDLRAQYRKLKGS